MPCELIRIRDGGTIVLCSSKRSQRCSVCRRYKASLQCDFPDGKATCDKHLCASCAVEIGPDLHACPSHPAGAGVQQSLGL